MDSMKQLPLLLLLFCGIGQTLFAQGYIDLTKEKAMKKLEKSKSNNSGMNISISATDTTLSYLVRDKTVQNLDLILYFDNKNRCYKERKVLTCDSCYQQFLNNILTDKYYRWTKINDTTYFSRFPYRIILTTAMAKAYIIELKRSDIAGNKYREMVRQGL